ncbi:hypothetical protein BJ742DRAFT_285333 [Cladochytrium replicatum]|nr:hypothetical protein BJ742DRAFT_285333 [Cladochytrium replicatum]
MIRTEKTNKAPIEVGLSDKHFIIASVQNEAILIHYQNLFCAETLQEGLSSVAPTVPATSIIVPRIWLKISPFIVSTISRPVRPSRSTSTAPASTAPAASTTSTTSIPSSTPPILERCSAEIWRWHGRVGFRRAVLGVVVSVQIDYRCRIFLVLVVAFLFAFLIVFRLTFGFRLRTCHLWLVVPG